MELSAPPKLHTGDKVAVVSPSWAGPAHHPAVHEVGLRALSEHFGLVPVEYPTTRKPDAAPEERAADLMAAFADPTIRAVLATIGGDDQITVLPHLDRDIVLSDPKPFVGYSDNTNLLNWLWNLGIVGYHGGSTMVHLARRGGLHPVSAQSLRHALFTTETVEVMPVDVFTDLHADWGTSPSLDAPLPVTAEPGWIWHNPEQVVTGRTWGGNLEILHWNLAVGRWVRPVEDYAGCVLLLETSEEMPSSVEVQRMLRNMGERGLLAKFPAVVMAKPKAWNTDQQLSAQERERFRADQWEALRSVMDTYNPDALVVFGPDFGHTDPQWVLPYGGVMTVDGPQQRIHVTY